MPHKLKVANMGLWGLKLHDVDTAAEAEHIPVPLLKLLFSMNSCLAVTAINLLPH